MFSPNIQATQQWNGVPILIKFSVYVPKVNVFANMKEAMLGIISLTTQD